MWENIVKKRGILTIDFISCLFLALSCSFFSSKVDIVVSVFYSVLAIFIEVFKLSNFSIFFIFFIIFSLYFLFFLFPLQAYLDIKEKFNLKKSVLCSIFSLSVPLYVAFVFILLGYGKNDVIVDGVKTIVFHGHVTTYGWITSVYFFLICSFFGACIGLIFYFYRYIAKKFTTRS